MSAALSAHLMDRYEQGARPRPDTQTHESYPQFNSSFVQHQSASFSQSLHGNQVWSSGSRPSATANYLAGNISEDMQAKIDALQSKLNQKLGPEFISQRAGPGGQKLTYAEGWKIINIANEVFGFNGWSSSIVSLTVDYIDEKNGKYDIGVTSIVRVTLRDGTYHEDTGYGHIENSKQKGLGMEKVSPLDRIESPKP